MILSRVEVQNFRRLKHAIVDLSPASFLIGPNNSGKSSVIRAVEALLSLREDVVRQEDFYMNRQGEAEDEIVLTGTFSDIGADVASSRGFAGRVIDGTFTYRKRYSRSTPNKPAIEALQYPHTVNPEFCNVRRFRDLVALGLTEEQLAEWFGVTDMSKAVPQGDMLLIPGAVDWHTDQQPEWCPNPGGFPSIVNSRLPKLLHIPSYVELAEFEKPEASKTKLGECLGVLFRDLLEDNVLAEEIGDRLTRLQDQMSPDDDSSLVGSMCREITRIIDEVFPECGLSVRASLEDLADILRPKYQVNVYSNVPTDTARQGTGLVRTAVFAMLRYHSTLRAGRDKTTKPLIIAFEEPEIYLHPHAANLLRDTIYRLGRSDQIICTSHSPWMIDLSRDPQSITRFTVHKDGSARATNFGVSTSLKALCADDRMRVKMLQAFDDELSRVFFADRAVIVEGDSEHIAIKETLRLLPQEHRNAIGAAVQIVRARGKATIASLARYLSALGIPFTAIHDRDAHVDKAFELNKVILEAVGDPSRVFVLEEC
ncbi:MAG: ATP-dependent endonuclease, partial [Bacillota bacterium]